METDLADGPAPQTGVGVVAPFDFRQDRELWRWVPADVTVYVARTASVPVWDNLDMVSRLNRASQLVGPTREVCGVGAEVVAYACTACAFVGGAERERVLREAMEIEGARHAVTAASAAVEAIRQVGGMKVAVVHPYQRPVGERLREFLAESGLGVADTTPLGLPMEQVYSVTYREVFELVRRGDRDDADAVFVSCTALPTYDVIAPLERELGKPVVTANQATMWASLRAIGKGLNGEGQSLAQSG
ncbi:maleate cis-trans isomerase family protein [Amycolatopsis sp. CA-230715]|uniref:maleate cis-trans isomerase family protein n=1 Tax=Amycolatopsis sp. CA-230715 TaxID=2745196 RepID=UPI001C022B76|nr:Asp/Glu racemase [Amycolatopsis sp. CA-230715]QWF78439.1 Maleate isomerase [Amycolatopsis sp. CA-230715]